MIIGVTLYGAALRASKLVPVWSAWMLVACGPGALAFTALDGYIPSGPTFPFAIVWLVIGFMFLFKDRRLDLSAH